MNKITSAFKGCSSDDVLHIPSPLHPHGMESVKKEICVLRKDFEAKMLQLNERIASISDSVKVSPYNPP